MTILDTALNKISPSHRSLMIRQVGTQVSIAVENLDPLEALRLLLVVAEEFLSKMRSSPMVIVPRGTVPPTVVPPNGPGG